MHVVLQSISQVGILTMNPTLRGGKTGRCNASCTHIGCNSPIELGAINVEMKLAAES
jgi:hypothetical protein